MRRFAPALFSLIAACTTPPLAPYEEARLHCQAQMYQMRVGVGRSPPNWTFYDQCMRARGYTR